MDLADIILYYIGLIVAFYFGYDVGSGIKETSKKLVCMEKKLDRLNNKIERKK